MLISVEVPPRQPKASIYAHGEKKKQSQFMLTETASQRLNEMADEAGLSRSEFVERLIRLADVEAVKQFVLESED